MVQRGTVIVDGLFLDNCRAGSCWCFCCFFLALGRHAGPRPVNIRNNARFQPERCPKSFRQQLAGHSQYSRFYFGLCPHLPLLVSDRLFSTVQNRGQPNKALPSPRLSSSPLLASLPLVRSLLSSEQPANLEWVSQ